MVTNNQTTCIVSTDPTTALAELKKARAAGYVFRGTGFAGVGFDNGEVITSFEGVGFPTWEDNVKTEDKGTYLIVSFNHKRVSTKSFSKDKFILTPKGELVEWTSKGGFAQFMREHPVMPEMSDAELLAAIQVVNAECQRLVSVGAKVTADFDNSVQGGYPHKVGKYNIVG